MKHLIIRADATSHIGIGHIMRCIALGQAWQDNGGMVIFLSHCESDNLIMRLKNEGFDFIALSKPHPDPFDLKYTLDALHKLSKQCSTCSNWLVVDGYHFDSTYQKSIKEAGYKLLCIDDYGHTNHYYADLILNQNITANESFYNNRESNSQLLLGTRYALLRREFKQWQGLQRIISPIARNVLVTLGGGDPENVTLKIIMALKQLNMPGLKAKIIVGPANPNMAILEQEVSEYSNFQLIKDASNMPELMAWADIAITAGGSTCWETAFMGLPNLIIILADNQSKIAAELQNYGLSINIGWHNNVSTTNLVQSLTDLINNNIVRKKMCIAGNSYVDGIGSIRVIKAVHCDGIIIRKASMGDCELLFHWVNDPDVRSSAFRSDPINFDEHKKWYLENLNNVNFIQFIAFDKNEKAIGQVRFDLMNGEANIDISVSKEFRRLGYGSCLIKRCVDIVTKTSNIFIFNANIKMDNKASIRSFEQAGFSFRRCHIINGQEAINMFFVKERSNELS